ncbi:MAG: hypothetical protein HUJ56_13750, partial [Erysipelotrichaceae bacterium]|nr:hypothetical protein [Erysipelotrichaceae bacterium]
ADENGHFFEYITGSASVEDDMISLAGAGNNVIFVQVPEEDTTIKKQAKALAQEGITIVLFNSLNDEVTLDTLFNASTGSLSDDEINTLGLTLIK